MKKKLIVIGAGDYSQSIYNSLNKRMYKIVGYIDKCKKGLNLGKPILTDSIDNIKNPKKYCYFVALGDVRDRELNYNYLKYKGLEVINVIDKSAQISDMSYIGDGNFIGKNCIIGVDVIIGNNNMINTGTVVEYHSRIGNHNRIAPNVFIACKVKDSCFFGVSSTSLHNIVYSNSTIGAGAVCLKNVQEGTTVVGLPAKEFKK